MAARLVVVQAHVGRVHPLHALVLLLAFASPCVGQGERDLTDPDDMEKLVSPDHETPGGGHLDLFGGGLRLSVPIYSASVSDALKLVVAARYSSKDEWYWDTNYAWWSPGINRDRSYPDDLGRPWDGHRSELGWGWRLTLGRIGFGVGDGDKYVFFPDGTAHKLYKMADDDTWDFDNASKHAITRDGTWLRATWFRNVPAVPGDNDRFSNRIYKVFAPDGTIYEYGHWVGWPHDCGDHDDKWWRDDDQRVGWYLTSICDPHGNRIDVEYYTEPYQDHIIKRIVDTHGRTLTTRLTPSNPEPALENLIESITYPVQSGTATVYFDYELEAALMNPPEGDQDGPMRVAALKRIRLPEDVTHDFERNDFGEMTGHLLPTGARIWYEYDTYSLDTGGICWYANFGEYGSCHQGRGVERRRTELEPGSPPTPENTYEWEYFRDQKVAEYLCTPRGVTTWRVHVRDPLDMWTSFFFEPNPCWSGADYDPATTTLPSLTIVWDRPFTSWPDLECGVPPVPPPGVQEFARIQNKWEEDDWFLHNGSSYVCDLDRNARVIHSKTTYDDGTSQVTNRCGWDGFGHHEFEALRSGPGAVQTLATARFRRTHYAALPCQWMKDLVNIEQVAEGGQASTVERSFTVDGQVAQEIHRVASSPYPPPGIPAALLAEYNCDNSGAPSLTRTRDYIDFENLLVDRVGNLPDLTNTVGQWVIDPNHEFCNGSRGNYRIPDASRMGLPGTDPRPPTTCSPTADFPPPTTPLVPAAGDVQASRAYYGSVSQAGNADAHGHAAWGQLKSTTTSGGDSPATFVQLQEWACGTLETQGWSTMSWLSVDRDVQCEGLGGSNTGLVTRERDTAGVATGFEYDELGRLRVSTPVATSPPPSGGALVEAPTRVDYSLDLREKQVIKRHALAPAGDGTETYETFDSLGRLVLTQTKNPDGALATQSLSLDAFDRVVGRSNWFETSVPHVFVAGPDATTYEFGTIVAGQPRPEPLRRVRLERAADGAEVAHLYVGLVTTRSVAGINDDLAQVSVRKLTRDALGRLVKVAAAADPTSPAADARYVYDRNDKVTDVTLTSGLDAQVRTWSVDGLGRIRSTIQPESGTTSQMKYDAMGNLISFRDADARAHGTEFDEASRLTASGEVVSGALQPITRLVYDTDTAPYGSPFSGGKMTRALTLTPGIITARVERNHAYAGMAGRLSRIDEIHRASTMDSLSTHFQHDALGNVSRRSAAEFTVVYGHRHGRPVTAGTPSDPTAFVEEATYDTSGGMSERVLGNGVVETVARDVRDRVSRIEVGPAGAVFDSGAYDYDSAGNLVDLGATATRGNDHFTYDLNGRLRAAAYAGVGTYFTEYDGFGNIATQRLDAFGSACASFELNEFAARDYKMGQNNAPGAVVTNRISALAVDPACHPGARITYANNGNVLQDETATYTWDIHDRLLSRALVSGPLNVEKYAYDANGWRAWRDPTTGGPMPDGDETHYFRDADGSVLKEHNTHFFFRLSREHVHFDGDLVATRELEGRGYATKWYHGDHLKSTRAITLADGSVAGRYDFGTNGIELPRVASGGQVRHFAGHLRQGDDSHDYMQARYFSVRHGRFLSVDPSGESASFRNPQSWNRYSYGQNNPLAFVDPDGRAALAVTYVGYKVQVPVVGKMPLGHSGVVLINNKTGYTKYFEYGRYNPTAVQSKYTMPNVKFDSEGKPTEASLGKLMAALSAGPGKGYPVEGAYFKDADFDKMMAFAKDMQAQVAAGKWEPYGLFEGPNCATFAQDTVEAGGVDTDVTMSNTPGNVISELQDDADIVLDYYLTPTPTTTFDWTP